MLPKFINAVDEGNYKVARLLWARGMGITDLRYATEINAATLAIAMRLDVPELRDIWEDYKKDVFIHVIREATIGGDDDGAEYVRFCAAVIYAMHNHTRELTKTRVARMMTALTDLGFGRPSESTCTRLGEEETLALIRMWASQLISTVSTRYNTSWIAGWTHDNILHGNDMLDFNTDVTDQEISTAVVEGLWESVISVVEMNAGISTRARHKAIRIKKCAAVVKYLKSRDKPTLFWEWGSGLACVGLAELHNYGPDFMGVFLSEEFIEAYRKEFYPYNKRGEREWH